MKALIRTGLGTASTILCATLAHAQVAGINDNLTGGQSSYRWTAFGGACLTAGNGNGTIPKCEGLPYYAGKTLVGGHSGRLPDPVGKGALRLTNGDETTSSANGTFQYGGVVSEDTVAANAGIEITFTTVTYGGNGFNGSGADGMSFFLADGAAPSTLGARGGSLGYSCSNTAGTVAGIKSSPDGVANAYIGIGIDEFGNFTSTTDATSTGIGPGNNGNRIALRAAGNTTWAALNKKYPAYYPDWFTTAERWAAVEQTCASGYAINFNSKPRTPYRVEKLARNYDFIESLLVEKQPIANQQATSATKAQTSKRADATPITYRVKISQDGLLDFTYAFNGGSEAVFKSGLDITAASGPLPATLRFGFGASSGGGSNVHEITCFKATPPDESNSSAGANAEQTAKAQAGTQVFLAYYHPVNWWGELRAQDLLIDSATDLISINPVANWNASCNLTGGNCPRAATSPVTAQSPANRIMLTWDPDVKMGTSLLWGSLNAAQRTALGGDPTRLAYLRGDRTREFGQPNPLHRRRTGVLGDILDSGPTWVGPATLPYAGVWADKLNPSATMVENGAASYADFQRSKANRTHVVYVGANDGFLHAFRSGAYSATDSTKLDPSVPNDGRELIAYMPQAVLETVRGSQSSFDYTHKDYAHNFYTDGTPGTGDVYYANAWHTWLVSGLGFGGNADGPAGSTSVKPVSGGVFALDITDPQLFSEANAASIVKGDWTSASLTCVGMAACGGQLGSAQSAPLIRRLHDGNWAAIFGNGLGSASGGAGIFIMHIDAGTGATSFRFLDTGTSARTDSSGKITARNGIAAVQSADLDGDHVTDFIYAGDAFGNLWRFDLTDANPSNWRASSDPLFVTAANQPITSRPAVSKVAGIGPAGEAGVMVSFGTGRQWPQTQTAAKQTITGTTQRLYGVWDWDMAGWNAKAVPTAQYAKLATAAVPARPANLLLQTITHDNGKQRAVSTDPVCWLGKTDCSTGNSQLGWMLNLTGLDEQVVYDPVALFDRFIVNTLIPVPKSEALSCGPAIPTGYSMAVSLANGGGRKSSFYADETGEFVNLNVNGKTEFVTGVALSGVGAPLFVTTPKGSMHQVQQTTNGAGVAVKVAPGLPGPGKRLTWIKRR